MALSTKVGLFQWSSAVGAGSTIAVTGVGFQPKALIFFWSGQDALDTPLRVDGHRGMGLAVSSTSRRAVGTFIANEFPADALNHDFMYRTDEACVIRLTPTGGAPFTDGRLDLQSMDSDGFTLIVDQQSGLTIRVGYIALGGADLTDVFIDSITEPGATGDQDITTPGFQPDAVLFLAAPTTADETREEWSHTMVGMVAGATPVNRVWAGGGSNELSTTAERRQYVRFDECIALMSATNTIATTGRATLTQWLSNGFRLNWAERAGSRVVYFLALKGGAYAVGDTLSRTTAGTITVSGLSFQPKVVAILGTELTAQSGSDSPSLIRDQWSFGAATSVTERAVHSVLNDDINAFGEIVAARIVESDAIYKNLRTQDFDAFIDGESDLDSMQSDGFVLDQTDPDPSAFVLLFFAAGEAGAPVLETRNRDAQLPLDFLGNVQRDPLLPVDFGGLETRSRDPLLPVDFGGLETLRRAPLLPVDYSAQGLRRDAQLPLDLSGIDPDLLLHRWLVLVKANLPILHSWDVRKLASTTNTLTHEWDVKEPLLPLPHRWNVTPDLLTPFGVDISTGGPLGAGSGDIQVPVATKDKTP